MTKPWRENDDGEPSDAVPAICVGRKPGILVIYEIRAFWEGATVDHGSTQEGSLRYRLTRALETWAVKNADAVTVICEGLRAQNPSALRQLR